MENNKRKTGSIYERRAVEFLITQGITILDLNFSLREGEIDIICLDKDTYVFVEVKYRKNISYGFPNEAVTPAKQKKICKVAARYIEIKKLPIDGSFRFDVISILGDEITWYKNAFSYQT